MSSWSILLALSGYEYDGPSRMLKFAPRFKPEKFKAFFCGPEGWGSLEQTRDGNGQHSTIAVVEGTPRRYADHPGCADPPRTARVMLGNTPVEAKLEHDGENVRVILATPQFVKPGAALTVVLA